MENKIKAIELSKEYKVLNDDIVKQLSFKSGFTNNKNYLGHTENGVPVYINELLNKGEIKKIMENEFKELPVGKYQAKVEQVIRKVDNGKETISLELKIEGFEELYYSTYCIKGNFSEIQKEIANKQVDKICADFNISTIDELAGKELIVSAWKNDKGYTNLTVSPKRAFFDWENYVGFKYTDEVKFDCEVVKFYKSKNGNKYVVVASANIDGKSVDEFVVYDFDKMYKEQNFTNLLKNLHLTMDDINNDLTGKKAKLFVKKVNGNGRVFINKRIGFDFKKKGK